MSDEAVRHLTDFSLREDGGQTPQPEPTKPVPVLFPEPHPDVPAVTEDCQMRAVARTDVGKVRQVNQDAVLDTPPLFGVADGMGGHKGGEIASALCRDGLISFLEGKKADHELLEKAVKLINRRIYIQSTENASLQGMGTTLTVLWAGSDTAFIAHVGDSRCYLFRDHKLTQLTNDHSMVMEMYRAGILTKEQAAVHPMRNVITRAIGTDRSIEVDILENKRRKDDVYLICSDGLYGQVPEERMQTILTEMPLEEAADTLLRETLEAGAPDNVSFVLLCDACEEAET